jgi:hypothetical protein
MTMHRWLLAGSLLIGTACGSEAPLSSGIDNARGDSEEDGKDASAGAPGRDAARPPGNGSKADGGTTAPEAPDFEECAATSADAERAARGSNVVWAIDTSGSMDEEAELVQNNMNTFVESITKAGLQDYRVVVVSERKFVTVPDPLGSDSAHFLHIEESVGSDEPLSDLIKRFGDYQDFLLPGVVTHFISVTDDESEITGEDFVSMMSSRLNGDFRLHAIASPPGDMSAGPSWIPFLGLGGCGGEYGEAAAPGDRHWRAAELTDGLTFSICESDWSALFSQLATAVEQSAAVPCAIELPAPPSGTNLDFDSINVVFTAPGEAEQPLPRFGSAAKCGDELGWHYDDPSAPEGIVLCPASCEGAANGGSLKLALGCRTFIQ